MWWCAVWGLGWVRAWTGFGPWSCAGVCLRVAWTWPGFGLGLGLAIGLGLAWACVWLWPRPGLGLGLALADKPILEQLAEFDRIVREGRRSMPPLSHLDQAEIADVLAYLRGLSG